MPEMGVTTYSDAVEHLFALLGSDSQGQVLKDCLRAVQAAYRELWTARRWSYSYRRGRITTYEAYSTGTIVYDHTGGANERQVTLTGGTWPDWVANGTLLIDQVAYQIYARISSTIITLSASSNPGADVSSTTYDVYQDSYPMPADFMSADQFSAAGESLARPVYVHPSDWLLPQQILQSPGQPVRYSFMPSPDYLGVMAVCFQPAPDQAYVFDYVYQKRGRPLRLFEYKTGTVSNSASATTLTGVGTSWNQRHVGSVVRVSAIASDDYPTGFAGLNPAHEERIVLSVESTTTLTVDAAFSDAHTGVKYVLSDPVDIEEGTMLTAFWRCVEKQGSISRHMKEKTDFDMLYRKALIEAAEADSRSFAPMRGGETGWQCRRFADMPQAADDIGP